VSNAERAPGPSPRRPGRGPTLLLVLLGLGFAWGVSRLIALRLAVGDVYPAYSSLRADPEGTRAFYEALGELSGVTVRRNYEPPGRLRTGPKTALLFLGTHPWSMEHVSRAETQELETAVRSGTRLVVTLVPRAWLEVAPEPTVTPGSQKSRKKRDSGDEDDEVPEGLRGISLPERWGFRIESGEFAEQSPRVPARLAPDAAPGLPATVPWKGAATIRTQDPAWKVVYRQGTNAVLVERRMGRGSIVLAADSTFVANGALKTARRPGLLVWLLDGCTELVFDETHLGMERRTGIAGLAQRYRLQGLIGGLIFLALLFVWKTAIPFAPASGGSAENAAVTGRRASEGLIAVLRRHVGPRELSRACFSEWTKSFARSRPELAIELSRSALGENPVAAYNRAAALEKESRTS
jgi:Domain of unknown function (DUF4350)